MSPINKIKLPPKSKIFGIPWQIFFALLILIYLPTLWFGLNHIGAQVVLSGYFLVAFGTWHLGPKRGFVLTLLFIFSTRVIIKNNSPTLDDADVTRGVIGIISFIISTFFTGWVSLLFNQLKATQNLLENEYKKTELLLLNTLPNAIAQKLKNGEVLIADQYDETTIMFCDIVGFTRLTRSLVPEKLIELLNKIVSAFDQKAEELGVEKIKTIGDAYMVVSGLPEKREDHAIVLTRMAIEMLKVIQVINKEDNQNLELRIGLHSGAVVGGVIGTKKFTFDMWGDTVNLAARLESHGISGQIHISEATYHLIKNEFTCIDNGIIDVKSYGKTQTYIVKND